MKITVQLRTTFLVMLKRSKLVKILDTNHLYPTDIGDMYIQAVLELVIKRVEHVHTLVQVEVVAECWLQQLQKDISSHYQLNHKISMRKIWLS